jgi:DNA-binding response OmpR family regulator
MSQTCRVLVGDDDVHDRYFLERGFKEVCPNTRVDFVQNGEAVMRYLEDTSHPLPALLIVDSMMPKIDGFAVLTWLRSKEKFDGVPVVMFSGNGYGKNIEKALELGAAEFVKKPDEVFELKKLIEGWRKAYLTLQADS